MSYVMQISINRCPVHKDFWSVSVNELNGGGTRITPGKCCGAWREVKSWRMDAEQLREAARVFEDAAEDAENTEVVCDGHHRAPAPPSVVQGTVRTDQPLYAPSGDRLRDALDLLDEVLARPNDWPLDDTQVGFWVSRANLLELRTALAVAEREEPYSREECHRGGEKGTP